ncbi:hypothetical protein F4803DRAFT_528680 [Xylaria telfairii]|nr:hypothetical protein F4803DRAFT_528680 [Xylaria telfairii]
MDEMGKNLGKYQAQLQASNDDLQLKRRVIAEYREKWTAHSNTEARLRGLLAEEELKVSHMEDGIREKDTELSQLRKDKEDLWKENKDLLDDKQNLKKEILDVKEKHYQHLARVEKRENEAAAASRREIEELKKEARTTRREFDRRIQHAEGDIEDLDQEKREVEEELATKSVALTEIEIQQEEAKKDLAAKSLALTEMEGQWEEAKEDLTAKSLALEKAQEEVAAKSLRLTEMKRQQEKAKDELAAKSLSLAETEGQMKKVEGELAAKSVALEKVQEDLTAKSVSLAETESQREKVEGELVAKSRSLAEAEGQREKVEKELASKSLTLTETERELAAKSLALEEVEGQLEKVQEDLTAKSASLAETKSQWEKVNNELAAKSLALTEMETQQQQATYTNEAIQERLARVFMVQSGCPGAGVRRWLSFVQIAGEADSVSCGDQLTEQGRVWTILQQWDSETVALSAVADTIEGLLVRLYGKVGVGEMDDEVVDLVRRLVVSTGTIGQVPFSLMRHVVEECLDIFGGMPGYHSMAIAFGLRQLVSIVSVRCSQDVGELQQRLEGMLSNQSTPLGALSALLENDQSGLKDRIRQGQVSLPDGSKVPVRYCPAQDIGILVLPGSAGYVWALELATNGIRRVVGSRLTVVENYEWRMSGIEGQYITLPSDDWEVNCEMIGGA